jgi:hypothetical protein
MPAKQIDLGTDGKIDACGIQFHELSSFYQAILLPAKR